MVVRVDGDVLLWMEVLWLGSVVEWMRKRGRGSGGGHVIYGGRRWLNQGSIVDVTHARKAAAAEWKKWAQRLTLKK
jgi:hypothetical protein